jgi:hypothetical protein
VGGKSDDRGELIVAENRGRWGKPDPLPDSYKSADNQNEYTTSCSSSGVCWAIVVQNNKNLDSYAIGEQNGKWTQPYTLAANLTLPYRWATGVSCWGKDSCTVAGLDTNGPRYITKYHGSYFLQTEVHGVWGKAIQVPDNFGPMYQNLLDEYPADAFVCTSMGDCWLGGTRELANGKDVGIVDEELGGKWIQPAVGIGVTVNSSQSSVINFDCSSASLCVSFGASVIQGKSYPFTQAEVHETWKKPHILPDLIGGSPLDHGLACEKSSTCDAVGAITVENVKSEAFVEEFSSGRWQPIRLEALDSSAPVESALYAIACAANGCWAIGSAGHQAPTTGASVIFLK